MAIGGGRPRNDGRFLRAQCAGHLRDRWRERVSRIRGSDFPISSDTPALLCIAHAFHRSNRFSKCLLLESPRLSKVGIVRGSSVPLLTDSLPSTPRSGFLRARRRKKIESVKTAPLQSLPPPLPVQTRRWLLEPAFSNPVHTPASPSKSGVLANDDQAFRGGLNYYSGHSMRLVTGFPPSPSSTDPASHPYTDTERNGAPNRGEGATHGDSRKPGV